MQNNQNGVQSNFGTPSLGELQEIADYLRFGFASPIQFKNEIITVNLTGISAEGQTLARAALDGWADVADLEFVETNRAANINFRDDEPGAFADYSHVNGEEIVSVTVNISDRWIDDYGYGLDGYTAETYIHEVGHALGAGHPGQYNSRNPTYETEGEFPQDSTLATVMSYFSARDNPNVDSDVEVVVTPMAADVIAMQDTYGAAMDVRAGDTTYGFGDTTGDPRIDFTNFQRAVGLTLVDSGGFDKIDLSLYKDNQIIDLNENTYSSFGGGSNNLSIGRGTVIEDVVGGSGNDVIVGNSASNYFTGGAGRDQFVLNSRDSGQDEITDFDLTEDALYLGSGTKLSDFSLSDTADGVLLSAADDTSMLLMDVSADELSMAQGVFV